MSAYGWVPYHFKSPTVSFAHIAYQARARSGRARRACALRALGLLLYSRILQWEGGRLFDRSAGFFYGNSCNSGTDSRKLFPRWEINRHAEGWKWAIDQNWGHMAKIGFLDQKPRFWVQKKRSLLGISHVLATPGKSCSKKKVAFAQIIITQNIILDDLGLKPIFRPKTSFRPNVKTPVSP